MPTNDEIAQPPRAPEIRRRLRLHPWQWVGVPGLILIPVLGLFGVFGETWETAHSRTPTLSVDVLYPERYRYKMLNSIHLDVTNTSTGTLDTVTVALDTAYASRFSTVVAIPDFAHPYTIELTDLPAGETRRVRVELQGEHYGRHTGELRVTAGGADTARVRLATFIFP